MKRVFIFLFSFILLSQFYVLHYHRSLYIYNLAKYNCAPLIKLYDFMGVNLNDFHYKRKDQIEAYLEHPLYLALHYHDISTLAKLINAGINPQIISPITHTAPHAHILSLIFAGVVSKDEAFALPVIGKTIEQEYRLATDTSYLKKIDHLTLRPLIESGLDTHIYSDGFNASVIQAEAGYMVAYRFSKLSKSNSRSESDNHIIFSYYDKNLQPSLRSNIVLFPDEEFQRQSDPRIFRYHDKLYILFDMDLSLHMRLIYQNNCMHGLFLGELEQGGDNLWHIKDIVFLHTQEQQIMEKNWSPLIHNNKLYFVYSIAPELVILEPNLETGKCAEISRTKNHLVTKNYGHVRGGTAYVPINKNSYISIAHFTSIMKPISTNVPLSDKRSYFMMPLIVSVVDDKFYVSHITKSPILANITPRNHDHWAQIIFPSGLFEENGEYKVTIGVNDYDSYLITLDKNKLLRDVLNFQQ